MMKQLKRNSLGGLIVPPGIIGAYQDSIGYGIPDYDACWIDENGNPQYYGHSEARPRTLKQWIEAVKGWQP